MSNLSSGQLISRETEFHLAYLPKPAGTRVNDFIAQQHQFDN